ncbi:MAG: hypothetical protein AB7V42_01230 [Thermoleophilia bacterium]
MGSGGDGGGRRRPTHDELVALGDGTLPAARAEEFEALAAADPELAADVAAERRAVDLLRRASAEAAGAGAPLALRERLAQGTRARPLRRGLLAGGVAVAAVAVALLALLLPSGSGGPTLAGAVDLATRSAGPSPAPDPAVPVLYEGAVDGVAFPVWTDEFGWRPDGARTDDLDGREAGTLWYAKEGRRIAYTIVAGAALDVPDGAGAVSRDGVALRVLTRGDRLVVTWLRSGRTCVLSGVGVDEDTLLKLAVWKGAGRVGF